jgi:hypothetical protein
MRRRQLGQDADISKLPLGQRLNESVGVGAPQ